MSELAQKIAEYYEKRELVKPSLSEALDWVQTEMGEVYEVKMSWDPKWIRNNPKDHPVKTKEDLAEEIGDVILMLMAAGMAEGVDPIDALEAKMKSKLDKLARINAELHIISEAEARAFEEE